MKHLKMSLYLLLTVAIFIGCEKETTTLPENSNLKTQPSGIENLSARPSIGIYGGELYALYAWNSYNNVFLYDYNPTNDDIDLNESFSGSTGMDTNFGFDYNYIDGLIYLLAGQRDWEYENEGYRNLYTWDKETNELTLIEQIVSVLGDERPQDLTFGNDGTLYFTFKNGEINLYNVASKTMSAFSSMSGWNGGVGLTYDFDNNRLIYVRNYQPSSLFSIEIPSGNVNSLFSFSFPDCYYGFANAIEYVGNNKLVVSGRNCDSIITVDLVTENVNSLSNSNNLIKDFMFFVNPDVDGDGVLNENDSHPNSDLREYLNIGDCNLNVKNKMVKNGSTMMDQINDLIAQTNAQYNGENYTYLHKRFMTELSQITYRWRMAKLITATQRSQISSCAWGANIPYYNNES